MIHLMSSNRCGFQPPPPPCNAPEAEDFFVGKTSFYSIFFIELESEHYLTFYVRLQVVHCKKINNFPVPSRDVTHQILPGRE